MGRYDVAYGYTREFPDTSVADAVRRVTEALKSEGFGVLTSIDMKDTLHKKIGVDIPELVILGACNPQLAYRALTAERGVTLLLPCNVTVGAGDAGQAVVQMARPQPMFDVVKNPALAPVVEEADQRLRNALAKV